eukprot:g29879.t1
MKELVIDIRKWRGGHTPVCINVAEMELVKSFTFLGVNITNDPSWSIRINATVKKAPQCLYFLRRLRRFSMSTMILTNIYRCTIESILSRCITA